MSSATVSAGSTDYIYNALGQLVEKSGNGGTVFLVYDESGHLLGEYSSTGTLIQETIWMGDIPVATLRPNGSIGCTTDASRTTRASDGGCAAGRSRAVSCKVTRVQAALVRVFLDVRTRNAYGPVGLVSLWSPHARCCLQCDGR
jgi:YD repeat-containing protein